MIGTLPGDLGQSSLSTLGLIFTPFIYLYSSLLSYSPFTDSSMRYDVPLALWRAFSLWVAGHLRSIVRWSSSGKVGR